MQLLKLVILD